MLAIPLFAIYQARQVDEGLDRLGVFVQWMIFTGGPVALTGIVLTIVGARRWPRTAATMGAIYFAGALAILGLGVLGFLLYVY